MTSTAASAFVAGIASSFAVSSGLIPHGSPMTSAIRTASPRLVLDPSAIRSLGSS